MRKKLFVARLSLLEMLRVIGKYRYSQSIDIMERKREKQGFGTETEDC